MADHVKITNKTRFSFRRAGQRFPAKGKGEVIVNIADLSEDDRLSLVNDPNLLIEPHADEPPASRQAKPKKAEAVHEKAMTAARKIKDPVKRQLAQEAANAALEAAQE